jgi:hypothetical protein
MIFLNMIPTPTIQIRNHFTAPGRDKRLSLDYYKNIVRRVH